MKSNLVIDLDCIKIIIVSFQKIGTSPCETDFCNVLKNVLTLVSCDGIIGKNDRHLRRDMIPDIFKHFGTEFLRKYQNVDVLISQQHLLAVFK